jgi:hypothetical protein
MMMPPAALLGGPRPQSQAPFVAALEAKLIPQDAVEKAIYNSAAVISQAKANILQSIAVLVEAQEACLQTVEQAASAQGTMEINGEQLSMAQFARKFRLARKEDADALAAAIEILREASLRIPVLELEKLCSPEPER